MRSTDLTTKHVAAFTFALLLAGTSITSMTSAGCYAPGAGEAEDVAEVGMTFEEFERTVYREPDSGIYIVNGDTPITTREELKEFYASYVRDGALIIHKPGGVVARWDDAQKLNITYCVSTTFGDRYDETVQAMASASGAWESAANVKFVHLSQYDGSCTSNQKSVVFDVRPVNSGQYLARAFFPNQSRSSRNVLIDASSYGRTNPDLTGVLRHELGHSIGFRHEHTRPESGTCFEDSQWQVLTAYDSSSVMHYPQCNGTGGWGLTLTNLDKSGAASVYGAPGGGGGTGGGGGPGKGNK